MSTLFGELSEIQAAQRATDRSIAAMQRALDNVASIALPQMRITDADRLRGAILEACQWLRDGSPGRALSVLEEALKL